MTDEPVNAVTSENAVTSVNAVRPENAVTSENAVRSESQPSSGEPVGGTRRDRDAAGRARNSRPRDGLGRPLAHGAAGIPRQPEGVIRTPAEALAEAQRLLDAGMPFHAHEVLEDAWKAAPADERQFWRALAQLAVGLTHALRGNPVGAIALLERGAVSLTPYLGTDPYGVDVGRVVRWATRFADRLSGNGPDQALTTASDSGLLLI